MQMRSFSGPLLGSLPLLVDHEFPALKLSNLLDFFRCRIVQCANPLGGWISHASKVFQYYLIHFAGTLAHQSDPR